MFGGVFEHHPNLRLTSTEIGSRWVPGLLGQLEWIRSADSVRWTETIPPSMSPIDYFKKHHFVGDSLVTRTEVDGFYATDIEHLIYGTHFPHTEGP